MIPFIEDAKDRLLTHDAIHIPQRCATYVVLAEDPKLRPAEWFLSYGMRGLQRFEDLSFVRFFGFFRIPLHYLSRRCSRTSCSVSPLSFAPPRAL